MKDNGADKKEQESKDAIERFMAEARKSRRHGGPYDRGFVDQYYQRPRKPHYYVGASYRTDRVEEESMTAEEIADYNRGYDEQGGGNKVW